MASKKLRLGVLLSGGGRTLTNILDAIKRNELDAEVATVIASRQCGGIQRGLDAALDTHLVGYKGFASQQEYSAAITKVLDGAGVDLVCMAGFLSLWIVPDHYQGKVMNIHPALLPMFGGKGMFGHHVHQAVLDAGCKVSGCTVHFVTNEYDKGPIIVQRCVPVEEGDSAESLAERVFIQECVAYPQAIRLFAAGRLKIKGDIVHILPQ